MTTREEAISLKFQVGDMLVNTINNTSAEIVEIKNGVAKLWCYEKIFGFFKITDKLVEETAVRTADLKLLELGIKEGYLKLKNEE